MRQIHPLAIILFFLLFGQYSLAQAPTNGLVAYYPFNGNGNDASNNGNNATAINGPQYVIDRKGKANAAAYFDGTDDYFTVAPSSTLNSIGGSSDFTFSSWVKSTGDFFILCKTDGGSFQYRLLGNVNNGLNADFENVALGISTTMPQNEWFFLACVKNGSQYTFYKDGIPLGPPSVLSNGFTIGTNTPLEIGRDVPGATEYTIGALDDIRIYKRALSAQEVKQLYQAEAPLPDIATGLVAHYPFDGNANDVTGKRNPGVPVGGVSYTNGANGVANHALLLDGISGYMDLGEGLNFNQSFTISFLAKTITNAGGNPAIFSQGIGELNQQMHVMLGPSYMRFAFYENTPLDCNQNFPGLNEWGYWVCTYDAVTESRRIYLNGKLICSDTRPPCASIGNTRIGTNTYDHPTNGFYHGAIDQVRIFNRSLSAYDVSELYQKEAPPVDTRTGLIAYYPFTENSNDESGNGNHGSRNEVQPTIDRHGESLKAYAFNGSSSYISVPASASLNTIDETSDATFAAWFNATNWTANGVFINKSGPSEMHYRFYSTQTGLVLQIGANYWTTSYSAPGPNTWHHLAGVKRGNSVSFYLNGQNIGNATPINSGYTFNKNFPLEIGRDAHGPTEWTNGKLDEVRIYNKALNHNDIFALYAEEKPLDVLPLGQVAYYPLNGNNLDFSTYKNHANNKGALLLVQDRFNKGKSAAYFDGVDDYMTVASTPSLELIKKEITIMAWVRPKPGFQEQSIISKYEENGTTPPQYLFGYNGDGLYFGFNSTANNYIQRHSTYSMVPDKWQHIAITYSGVYIKFYVNGKLISQIPQRGEILKNTMPIQLARNIYGTTSHYNGWMDEVRIFNKVLTEKEIMDYKGLDPKLEELPNLKEPLIVDGFDYPIGDRGYDVNGDRYEMLEGFQSTSMEKNGYYPSSPDIKPVRRGFPVHTKNNWYNINDIGSYLSELGGIHPGEDWNYSLGDKGEEVYAVANGKVIKFGQANSKRLSALGWYIVLEHPMPNLQKIYSIYCHVAPLGSGGKLDIKEFPFNTFKEGDPVKRGQAIAVISEKPTDVGGSHLHFEIRTLLDIDKGIWPGAKSGYYQVDPNKVEDIQKVYNEMFSTYGYVDPSDFIDENRIIESSNFGNRILLGQFNSSINNVPILFTLKNPSEIVSQISDVFVDFGDPNLADMPLEVVPNSLKQVGQGKWMFRINRTTGIIGLDLSKQFTLVFNVKKANGSQGRKRAFNQVLFQDYEILRGDVQGSTYETYIESGIRRGLFSGFGTKFNTGDAITRAALATFAVRAWTSLAGNSFDLNEKSGTFDNIPETNSLYPFVQTLRNKGAIDLMPLFDEKSVVSLEEAAEVVCKLFNIKRGNAQQLKRKLPISIESNENKYLNLLLNCFISRNGSPESVIGSVDIENKVFSRGVMAKMVVNALRYSVVGGIGITLPGNKGGAMTLSEDSDSSFSRFSIIGDKREQSVISNSSRFTHPFKLDTIYIKSGDSISIGGRIYSDLKGNSLFYHWVSNNGTISPLDPSYSQIKFTPNDMKYGDTARLYSHVSNNKDGFSEGWITIIVDSQRVSKNNDAFMIDSVFTNFGVVKTDSTATRLIRLAYPANGQGALLGDIKIADTAFSLKGNTRISVTPGETRLIEVQFFPKKAGTASGTIVIEHNSTAYPNPMLLSLYGMGVDSTGSLLNPQPTIVQFPCDSFSTNGEIELSISDTNIVKSIAWYKGIDSIASGRRLENITYGDYSFKIIDTTDVIFMGQVYLPLKNSLHATWESNSALCGSNSGSLNIIVSGGSGQYRYVWSVDSTLNKSRITGFSGDYQVMVTDSLSGCKKTFQERINSINSDFDFYSFQIQPICNDSLRTIILRDTNGVGPVWYTFSDAQPAQDTIFRIPSGTYSVLAQDSVGCSAIQTITIADHPSFRFGVSVKESICGNPAEVSVTALGGSGLFQYKWDEGAFSDTTILYLSPGIHQIQVTDGICAESRSFSIITRNPQPYFTTDSIDVELGAVVSLINKTAEPASYRWFLNDHFNSSSENYEFIADTISVFKVGLEAMVNNCVDTFIQNIKVYPTGVLSSCLKRTSNSGWFGQAEIWQNGVLPNDCDSVVVLSGDTLRLQGTRKIRSLYVEDGGVLEILDEASNLVLGDSLNTNSNLTVAGKVIINGGTLRVHGIFKLNSLSNFNMHGGLLIIDKNPTDSSGLEAGNYLFDVSDDVVKFLFDGGVLQIVNPPGSIGTQAIGCPFSFGDNTTLMIGDGKSTLPTFNPLGFGGDQLPAKIGRLIVDGKTLDGNRHFLNKKPLSVKSEVRIISGKVIQEALFEVRQ